MKTTKIFFVLLIVLLLAACGGRETEDTSAVPSDTSADSSASTDASAAQADTSADSPASVAESASVSLSEEYENALTLKNQLLLGTLHLEGTEQDVTAQQAESLLPFWQLYRSLIESGTAATEETDAVQSQILDLMTPDQIAAIAAFQFTKEDLQNYYVEIGAKEAKDETTTLDADATGVPMRDMNPEEKATAQAERGVVPLSASGSGPGLILLDIILEFLEEK